MRIIGNINHPKMKITIFKMDNKLSAKFEMGLLEQTYKFREHHNLKSFEDTEKLITDSFMEEVFKNFQMLQKTKLNALDNYLPKIGEEFEEII